MDELNTANMTVLVRYSDGRQLGLITGLTTPLQLFGHLAAKA
jgi:hypothetical protein